MFIAYTSSNPDQLEDPPTPADCNGAQIAFLEGCDQDDLDPNDQTVRFSQCLDVDPPNPNDPNAIIQLACGNIKSFIPARDCSGSLWTRRFNQTTPQVAFKPADPAEPNDADRLYLVHHDLSWWTPDPNDPNSPTLLTRDVDVFLWVLTRVGGYWDVGAPIRVNQDNPNAGDGECDQFLANVACDSAGRIHVVFYDDREYSQDDGQPPTGFPQPRFDYFHVVSPDLGTHWFESKLVWPGGPCEPTIDLNYPCNEPADPNDPNWLSKTYNLGEYTSIATYPVCWGDDVWTAFSGTWSGDLDPNNDKSVIWYACLRFGPDLNANGIVDVSDLAALLAAYNSICDDPYYNVRADFNADCLITLSDLATLLGAYGRTCESYGGAGASDFGGEASGAGGAPGIEPAVVPVDTHGLREGDFAGESRHFVFDLTVALADQDDDWTLSGLAALARNGAVFRLAAAPTEQDPYACHVSVPRDPSSTPPDVSFSGAADVEIAGGYRPIRPDGVFDPSEINLTWFDKTESTSGPSAVARLVLDVGGISGADVSAGLGSVSFSTTGPVRTDDVAVAELTFATGCRFGRSELRECTGVIYAAGR